MKPLQIMICDVIQRLQKKLQPQNNNLKKQNVSKTSKSAMIIYDRLFFAATFCAMICNPLLKLLCFQNA